MGLLFDKFVKLKALQEELSQMSDKAENKSANIREKYKVDVILPSNTGTADAHSKKEGDQER